MATKTFNPKDVKISIGGQEIKGFCEDIFQSIKPKPPSLIERFLLLFKKSNVTFDIYDQKYTILVTKKLRSKIFIVKELSGPITFHPSIKGGL